MMKHDERFNGSFGLKNNIKKGNKKRINRFGISKERKGVWYSVITVALLVFVLVILSVARKISLGSLLFINIL